MFNFRQNWKQFPKALMPLCIFFHQCMGVPVAPMLTNAGCYIHRHSSTHEELSPCIFTLQFPEVWLGWVSFKNVYCPFGYLVLWRACYDFYHCWILGCLSFTYWMLGVIYIPCIYVLCWLYVKNSYYRIFLFFLQDKSCWTREHADSRPCKLMFKINSVLREGIRLQGLLNYEEGRKRRKKN